MATPNFITLDGTQFLERAIDDAALNLTGDFTISFQTQRLGGTGFQIIMGKFTTAIQGWVLFLENNDFVYEFDATRLIQTASTFNNTNVHRIIIQRSGNNHSLWVDGVLAGSTVSAQVPTVTTVPFHMARRSSTSVTGDFYTGRFYDLAVWNVALTGPQISALNSGAAAISFPTGLQGAWIFNSLEDLSVNNRDLGFFGTGTPVYGAVTVLPQPSDASWMRQNNIAALPVVTANSAMAPDGTMTADTISFPAVGVGEWSQIRHLTYALAFEPLRYSVYLRANTPGVTYLWIFDGGINYGAMAINVTTTWTRYAIAVPAIATNNRYVHIGCNTIVPGISPSPAVTVEVWNPILFSPALNGPVISSLTPNLGPVGTPVIIQGANFLDGAEVKFDTTPASSTFVSENQIDTISPSHASGPVFLTLTNPDLQSTTALYAYASIPVVPQPPIVSNIQPSEGPLNSNQILEFDVTDEDNSFKRIIFVVEFPELKIKEVAYDGLGFGPIYTNGFNSQVAITDGYHFTLFRDGGWPTGSVILTPFVLDTTGEENV